jgi:hypothetical protein
MAKPCGLPAPAARTTAFLRSNSNKKTPREAFLLELLCWIPGLLPGGIPTQEGFNPLETGIDQDARRTGAAFFRRSGAVGDDPLIRVQLFHPAL